MLLRQFFLEEKMNKVEIVQQTKLAFDFIQKLYFEVSYLIKEIEGLLAEEEEQFIIGRPGGYSITNRASSGLESNNVNLWLIRMLSVFFVPLELTKTTGGLTTTEYTNGLKVIFLRIVLDDKDNNEPYIYIGVMYDIAGKRIGKYPKKFEELIRHLEYAYAKVFTGKSSIDYEDNSCKFKGKFIRVNLFDVNSSEEIIKLVTTPVLKLFRETK
jgi:hypothetical protein